MPKGPDVEPLLQFFNYDHLTLDLQEVSKPFCEMARNVVKTLPRNSQRTRALNYLISAKDAAVRAKLYVE